MEIDNIVNNNLCTGCGVCISEDDSKTAKMIWNKYGFLVPRTTVKSNQSKMIDVCPFKINQLNEDELAIKFIEENDTIFNSKIGHHRSLYAGYSKEFRETSSSGGLATFVFEKLLLKNFVQSLFVVVEYGDIYAFRLVSEISDITEISKTRYIPVTLENLFTMIDEIDGKVAVSGVACFVKAIRLKQNKDPKLKEKIPFVVGIICGGLKSKHYTEFLVQSSGCYSDSTSVEYRVKNKDSHALDYKFSCKEKKNNRIHMVEMQKLGDMWGSGLFKSNACDYCDDVVTELADISLGDAWLDPYKQDGSGNSVIITRSVLADEIIKEGIKTGELSLDLLSLDTLLQSQQGSFNHRHKGLLFRIKNAKKEGELYPIKRRRFLEEQNIFFNLIQKARLNTRKYSLIYWTENPDITVFNKRIEILRARLRLAMKWHNRFIRIKNIPQKIKRLL